MVYCTTRRAGTPTWCSMQRRCSAFLRGGRARRVALRAALAVSSSSGATLSSAASASAAGDAKDSASGGALRGYCRGAGAGGAGGPAQGSTGAAVTFIPGSVGNVVMRATPITYAANWSRPVVVRPTVGL